jgi:hypothetical protein
MPAPMITREILTDEQIARRAYEIFQARGAQHGADLEDWLQAERDLKGLISEDS